MVLARLASREHSSEIAAARALLPHLAPLAEEEPGRDCQRVLRLLRPIEPRFANVGVLSTTGQILCSAVQPTRPVDFSRSRALLDALRSRDVVVGDYQIGPIVSRPVLLVAVAARGADGTPRAVPFVALDLRWLHGFVERAALPRGSVVTIFDHQGRVLARSADSKRWVGRTLPARVGFERVFRRREGVFEGHGVDGVLRLWAFHALESVEGAAITVGIPSAAAFGGAQRAQRLHVVAFAFILLFALAAGVLGADLSVLRGVRAVTSTARRLAAGELGARAPARLGAAEIRELSAAFNAMAIALELRQAQSEESGRRLRALAARIQTAREEEAARIARELHDVVGQALTALKLDVTWLGRPRAHGAEPSAPGTEPAALIGRIDETIGLVRKLSQELRPAVLDRLGLGEAITWQAREFEARTGLPCTVDLSLIPPEIDPEVAVAAFRIVQEALTNVVRHARARSVTIRAASEDGGLDIEVCDDGRGADPGMLEGAKALGIQGMRERVQLLDGSLRIECAPGMGTAVRARIPLSRAGQSAGPG
jgi:signal transduction histidine kinase